MTANDTRTKEEIAADAKQAAKDENAMNAAKRKLEGEQAQWSSPERKSLSGDEVHPQTKVVADKPAPENDEVLQAEARARAQKDASKK